MVGTNRTENVQTRASGHLQIENHGIRIHLPDTSYRFQRVACLSGNLNTPHVSQEVGEAINDNLRVVRDKNFHFLPPGGSFAHLQRMTNSTGNTSGRDSILL
jgi:hypothetical protein